MTQGNCSLFPLDMHGSFYNFYHGHGEVVMLMILK
jgi:hypothetical protein